ncbi:MAG: glycogen-binding domain-containing protein [Kiritimatiellia bacterium]
MKIKVNKKSATPQVAATQSVKPCARKCAAKKAATPKVARQDVTFTLHAEKGKTVYLAGEFNQWDPTAKKMAYKAKSGLYSATLKLAPGTYQYKYVLDGTWCADPENVNCVPNDQGTFNSVITVK